MSLATPEELNISSHVRCMCTGISKDEIFLIINVYINCTRKLLYTSHTKVIVKFPSTAFETFKGSKFFSQCNSLKIVL